MRRRESSASAASTLPSSISPPSGTACIIPRAWLTSSGMNIVIPEGTGPIGIYGYARPRPERAQELESLLLSFVESTRAEPGAWQYQVHRDASDPTTLVFYELWRSGDDLRNHLAQPN